MLHATAADEKFPSTPPVEPAQAAKTLRVKNGFTMDLVAAEPLVASPVAICYDENGAAYVVEMRDYPYTNKDTHQAYKDNTTDAPIGRVRKLIDRDGDGKFDESTVFAEGLSWPTGVCCWQGGVFVTATPDIWYLKDTDGDGRADVREKVFTGFRKYNVQAVINTPLWGLDNRITFAGGSNGGQVASLRHPEVNPLRIARNDLRIDPRTGTMEAIAGGARFGHGMDDWGNRFLCNIRNPAQHVVFDGTLTARNPFLPVPNPVYDARESGDQLPVMRISPLEPWRDFRARRWVAENHAVPRSELVAGGVFTSAAGITIYRGAAYPPEYRGQAFVAEVANNLVQRQTVTKDGVTFKIETADKDAEFIASTDLWFRAVNFYNAPDGTLHVVDMYRETIEHPWSIPDDIRAQLDLESGRDRGRIYRLSPPGFKAPKPPRLGGATTTELVATLENPNSWWRETAQRLLFERQDQSAVGPLRALLAGSRSELARLHALWTLDGLGALAEADLTSAMGDNSAGVREHAVRLAAPRLGTAAELRARVFALARDREVRVRYQVAFAAGGVSDDAAVTAALEILRQDGEDRWVRAAALSARPDQCARMAERLLADPERPGGSFGREIVRQLAYVTGAQNKRANLEAVFAAFTNAPGQVAINEVFWTGLGDGLRQAGRNLRTAISDPQSAFQKRVAAVMNAAQRIAASPQIATGARVDAVRLLAYDDFASVRELLGALLTANDEQPLQLAAIRALATFAQPDVARTLLEPWAGYTPAAREEVLAALLARRDRVTALLDAIEGKVVNPAEVSAARRTQILANPDGAIKARAGKLFGTNASGTRAEVVAKYQAALSLAGDGARGAKVYDNVCAACHRFAGRGTEIGPNLETVRGWDREKLLLNILDPNREVAANYAAYTIELKDGSSLAGMIVEENAASIALKRIGAPDETILRQNIAKITSAAQSLMPEGLEATISPPDMADLIAYLKAP
ncbi:MAG TPA: PVC-type heme-binding CxxCH protein [Opitutaceae bacterium]|nr:PVC-type heme-binding CxxCH protein [Opitutaceae bacterium]